MQKKKKKEEINMENLESLKGCLIKDIRSFISESRYGSYETFIITLDCKGKEIDVKISSYSYEDIWGPSSGLKIKIEND